MKFVTIVTEEEKKDTAIKIYSEKNHQKPSNPQRKYKTLFKDSFVFFRHM